MLKQKGAMLAVGLEHEESSRYISMLQTKGAIIACVNSPSSTIVSEDEPAILKLKETFDKSSIFARRLKVDTVYHSHHMQTIADIYQKSMHALEFGAPCYLFNFSRRLQQEK